MGWVNHLSNYDIRINQVSYVCPLILENTLPCVCGPSVPTCWQLGQQRATSFSTTTGLGGIYVCDLLLCCTHWVCTVGTLL